MAGNEGRMVGMRDSTVFCDLAHRLEREATRLRGLGYAEWAGHFLEDADRLLGFAEQLAQIDEVRAALGEQGKDGSG